MNAQASTINASDGWRIEYSIGAGHDGFTNVFDADGHYRGGCFNARPAMVEEELAQFKRDHGDESDE